MPAFALGLGAVAVTAFALGGNVGAGAAALVLIGLVGVLFARLSRDPRWRAVDVRASSFSGLAVIAAAAGAWLYQLAEGHDGSPYGHLVGGGGLAYTAAAAPAAAMPKP
jgi:hypothetical protein